MFVFTNIIYNLDVDKGSAILKLLKILKENTDFKHVLKEKELKDLLNKEGLIINDRKVIYDLINALNDNGYQVIYDATLKGYYLDEAPFSKGEIKILSDSLNNHKELDTAELNNKLLGFISLYNQQLIKDNQIVIKSTNKAQTSKKPGYFSSYGAKIEKVLDAINEHLKIEMFHNGKFKIIEPYFLYFSNNKYYVHDANLYSYRIDRISYLRVIEEAYEYDDRIHEKIIRKIKTSFDNFDKNESTVIVLKTKNFEEIKNRLYDDFPGFIIDNNKNVIVEYKPNEIFFSKIVAYNGQLVIIKPESVKEEFHNYLTKILKDY